MNKRTMKKFLEKEITCRSVKELIEIILKNSNLNVFINVHAYVLSIPCLSNGYMGVLKWKGNYHFSIYINIYPYIMEQNMANRVKWFYIYVTIMHEIEHINLLINNNVEWDYSTYIATIEEMETMQSIAFSKVLPRLLFGNKSKNKMYSTSSAELFCRYKSFKNAYGVFDTSLSALEKEKIQIVLESSKFLVDYMEIGYSYDGTPFNKFNKSVVRVQKNSKKRSDLFIKYPQLCCIYTADGKLKSFEKIYQERNDKNKKFIDCILLQIFMNLKQDYNLFFQNNIHLKKHIEFLTNEYCNACISYMEKESIGTIFLKKEILDDNALLLLKNVRYINKLMDVYNMVHTSGSLFYVE